MRHFAILLTGLVMSLSANGLAVAQDAPTSPAELADPARPADADARDEGLAQWETIHAVFSHPRCANCHVEDDRPRWSGAHYGATRVHGFNVQRGDDGFGHTGARCVTCHQESNAEVLHGPPGAPAWHLAPSEMVWFDRSSAQICAQIKDPARNGNRTLAEVAVHVRDDALVAWGWAPGPGREPAPYSAEETFAALERWSAAGAPCPED